MCTSRILRIAAHQDDDDDDEDEDEDDDDEDEKPKKRKADAEENGSAKKVRWGSTLTRKNIGSEAHLLALARHPSRY